MPGSPVSDPGAAGPDGPRAGTASQHKAARTAPAATAGKGAALTGSIVASAVCGALAVVWGVLSGARIILFATGRAGLVDYVDPVLVVVACAALVPTPLRLLRSAPLE